jgi:hypothetical protein
LRKEVVKMSQDAVFILLSYMMKKFDKEIIINSLKCTSSLFLLLSNKLPFFLLLFFPSTSLSFLSPILLSLLQTFLYQSLHLPLPFLLFLSFSIFLIEMDSFKKAVTSLKDRIVKTPLERSVLEACSDENWGVATSSLHEIAEKTFNYDDRLAIMKLVWELLKSPNKEWRRIYKVLSLIENMVKFGSTAVLHEIQDEAFKIRMLQDFSFREGSEERGIGIRDKAKYLTSLLNDRAVLDEEREKAKKTWSKFSGISSDNTRQYEVSSWRAVEYDPYVPREQRREDVPREQRREVEREQVEEHRGQGRSVKEETPDIFAAPPVKVVKVEQKTSIWDAEPGKLPQAPKLRPPQSGTNTILFEPPKPRAPEASNPVPKAISLDPPFVAPSFPPPGPTFPQPTPSFPPSAPSFPPSVPSFPQTAPSFPPSAPSFPLSAPSFPLSTPSFPQPVPSYPQPAPVFSQPPPGGYLQPAPGFGQPTPGIGAGFVGTNHSYPPQPGFMAGLTGLNVGSGYADRNSGGMGTGNMGIGTRNEAKMRVNIGGGGGATIEQMKMYGKGGFSEFQTATVEKQEKFDLESKLMNVDNLISGQPKAADNMRNRW